MTDVPLPKGWKTITFGSVLTADEIAQVADLFESCQGSEFARVVATTVIEPNIERIKKACGQEVSPLYLAYAIEYLFVSKQGRRW